MKSIANQYRDLKEGRMSQFNFMRNLRMSMPQYITNVTSFNDAVKILKNKSILTEMYDGPSEPEGDVDLEKYFERTGEHLDDIITKAIEAEELTPDQAKSLADYVWNNKATEAETDGIVIKNAKKGYSTKETAQDLFDNYINRVKDDDELAAMIAKAGEEEKAEKAIKGGFGIYDPLEEAGEEEINESEYTYRKINGVCYKIDDENNRTRVNDRYCRYDEDLNEGRKKKEPKKELHPNQIHPQELRMGIKVELEHTKDIEKAKKFALDHLKENPFYYTALKLSGIESPSAPKAKAPKEAPKKVKKKDATELVDKDNQMVKVKLMKEALEKLIREELSKKNLAGGEYMFSGTLTKAEVAELEEIPNIEIEVEELEDTYKTVVSHPEYSGEQLKDIILILPNSKEAREQLKDIEFEDNPDIDANIGEVTMAIEKHWDGGVKGFLEDIKNR